MFTGLVSAVGRIAEIRPLGAHDGVRLSIEAPDDYADDLALGDSVAINGACMTVTALDRAARCFSVDVSAASLAVTAGLAQVGRVNLEKAVRATDRLGGHLVSGHVDGVGVVTGFAAIGASRELTVLADPSLARFLAYKGSIAVDGVSLTVNRVSDRDEGCEFKVNLIAHTLETTTLGTLRVGQRVNLEVDLVARYVERMLGAPRVSA
jgi:riboflavin synthase